MLGRGSSPSRRGAADAAAELSAMPDPSPAAVQTVETPPPPVAPWPVASLHNARSAAIAGPRPGPRTISISDLP